MSYRYENDWLKEESRRAQRQVVTHLNESKTAVLLVNFLQDFMIGFLQQDQILNRLILLTNGFRVFLDEENQLQMTPLQVMNLAIEMVNVGKDPLQQS